MKKTIYSKNLKAQFHPTFGNEKLGGKNLKIMAVGYLSGDDIPTFKDGRPVVDMVGTCNKVDCSGCKGSCYAMRTQRQYNGVTIARAENTLQLRKSMWQHFQDIKKAIIENNISIVRYTESGEIESYNQFQNLVNLARDLSHVRFYLYTKNYHVLHQFFDRSVLPENLVVLISIWGDIGVDAWHHFKIYRNVKAFVVNNHEGDLASGFYCPAYRRNTETGKVTRDPEMTCAKCGLCFKSPAKVIHCLEH